MSVTPTSQIYPKYSELCAHGTCHNHPVLDLNQYPGPRSHKESTLGVFVEFPPNTWDENSDNLPSHYVTHLVFFPTTRDADPTMPSLQKLPRYIKGEWSKKDKEKGYLLHDVWGTLHPRHKDKTNSAQKREIARETYQNLVSGKFAELFQKGFDSYLDSDKTFTNSNPRVYIKGLNTAQMTKFCKMQCCDIAHVDNRSVSEGESDPVAPGSINNAHQAGTTSFPSRGKPSKKDLIALRQAPGTSVPPTVFNPQGPSSNTAATLALTLQKLTYPASIQDPLGQVQPMFTYCRKKGVTLEAKGASAQTLIEFLQRFHIPEDTWDSGLDSLVQEEWESSVDEQRSCIKGHGTSRKALETRLGHAIARYISEKISSASTPDSPLSVRYLRPETYNILRSQYPAHKTFPFESVDEDGYLKRGSIDNNKQLPPELR